MGCAGEGSGGCGDRDPHTDTPAPPPARLLRFPLRFPLRGVFHGDSVPVTADALSVTGLVGCEQRAVAEGEDGGGGSFACPKPPFPLLLTASQILALLEQQLRGIPVPAASPGTGWAGVTGVNGAVVTQLRVLILHCGLCVQLLIALCRGWRVRQPRIRGASGAGSHSLLSVLLECWSPWHNSGLERPPG